MIEVDSGLRKVIAANENGFRVIIKDMSMKTGFFPPLFNHGASISEIINKYCTNKYQYGSEHFQIYGFSKENDIYTIKFFFGHALGSKGIIYNYKLGYDNSILEREYNFSWNESAL